MNRYKPGINYLLSLAAVLAMALAGAAQAAADADAGPQATVEQLRAELLELRREYSARLAELERRLAELEGAGPATTEATQPAADELARLRQAAREAAGDGKPAVPAPQAAVGRERNLNRLNPEISFTGIFVGRGSDAGREEFAAEEFELDLQSALDPFSRTRWTIAFGDEGVEIEEGYVLYSSLPGGLELTAGRFRQSFGPLNRQHLHALPQTEYPLVYRALFGDEGLAQTGVSFAWLLPRPWATANEIVLQITDGENEEAFAGESFEDLSVLARLKNFWQVSDATYFEWGLSGITGKTAAGGDSQIFGTDFTLSWQPPSRAKYRALVWRTELLRSERDAAARPVRQAWGGYSYLEGLLIQNLWAGLRLDWAEDPLEPERRRRGLAPYFTWWQSEYVRLRAEYGWLKDELSGESENRFALQLTWAAGPHKHESY